MTEADRAEDQVAISFASLRAAIVLFKADREAERVSQYADLVKITGDRAAANEFFLSARTASSDPVVEDDPTDPAKAKAS